MYRNKTKKLKTVTLCLIRKNKWLNRKFDLPFWYNSWFTTIKIFEPIFSINTSYTVSISEICPENYTKLGAQCFQMVTQKMTLSQAETECQNLNGGTLAYLEDTDMTILADYMSRFSDGKPPHNQIIKSSFSHTHNAIINISFKFNWNP